MSESEWAIQPHSSTETLRGVGGEGEREGERDERERERERRGREREVPSTMSEQDMFK